MVPFCFVDQFLCSVKHFLQGLFVSSDTTGSSTVGTEIMELTIPPALHTLGKRLLNYFFWEGIK
jgi:hypothetical protein